MESTSSMDLGLYDMDLSLFGGDLLVGLQPTSAELKEAQDGQKSSENVISSPAWATTDLDVSLGHHDELANGTSLSSTVMDQPLDISWMDSKVDLLDLLAQEGEFALAENNTITIKDDSLVAEDNANAVKVLQEMAEETSQILAMEAVATGDRGLDRAVAAQAANNLQSVVVEISNGTATTSVDHLLDMLATGMEPPAAIDLDVAGDVPMPLPMDTSDILTSVTAEDVESILSSEPSSPAASGGPLSELPPEQSNSLLAKYLVGDLGTISASHVSSSPSFDISDLDSMTSDTPLSDDDDDSDYVPSSFRVSKTRSTPYSRNSKTKPGPKSKAATIVDKEARILDRKLRKKQQNKDAATRYRQKKREEADLIDRECDELEERNTELKDKVDQMTREIGYLKNLLAEVYKARGLMAPKLGK